MPQTPEGALKSLAKRRGMTVEELTERLQTESYCYKCQQWKPRESFGADKSRSNGLNRKCLECNRVKVRKTTKGVPSPNRGKKHTAESRAKMSAARIGNQNRKGKPFTEEQKKRISQTVRSKALRGSDNPRWKGTTPELQRLRASSEYADWRVAVFERDNYTCQKCGDKRGGNLHAHHIKPFADYPNLRFDVANGLTLCELCHWEEHGRPIDLETEVLIDIAIKYARDMFGGTLTGIARAFNVSYHTVKMIALREGRFADDE